MHSSDPALYRPDDDKSAGVSYISMIYACCHWAIMTHVFVILRRCVASFGTGVHLLRFFENF